MNTNNCAKTNNNFNDNLWNDMIKPKLSIIIGTIGMLLCIYSNLLPSGIVLQKVLYLVSAGILFTAACIERQAFFMVLQIIILAGTLVAFTPMTNELKAAIPIVLSVFGLIYLAKKGLLKEYYVIIGGCGGLILLAAGYAISNPFVYFFGGLFLSVYSFIAYKRGVAIALLWAILNAFFSITALIGIYHLLAA